MTRPPPAAALAFESVAQSYPRGWGPRRPALSGVSFTVAPGASLGLVGPNGAGKSTCLRLAAGIERPRAGRVSVFGLDASERAARERLGYVPEGFPFPAELSARSALDLVARLAGLARGTRHTRVPELLEEVGLSGVARERLGAFSRGMQRRFALAQAFVGAPDLVLLDEPTTGLDASGFGVLRELLLRARERGAALVIASHWPALLAEHCQTLCVLVDGRVRASASAAELAGSTRELASLAALYGAEERRAP